MGKTRLEVENELLQIQYECERLKKLSEEQALEIKALSEKRAQFEQAGQMRSAALATANLVEGIVGKKLPILRKMILDLDRQVEFQDEILELVGVLKLAQSSKVQAMMGPFGPSYLYRW